MPLNNYVRTTGKNWITVSIISLIFHICVLFVSTAHFAWNIPSVINPILSLVKFYPSFKTQINCQVPEVINSL